MSFGDEAKEEEFFYVKKIQEKNFYYHDFFSEKKMKFLRNFPEFSDVLQKVSYIFKDPFIPEITTLVFGNNGLSPENFLNYDFFGTRHAFSNKKYSINDKEFCELILRNFLANYRYFFEDAKYL